MSQPQEAIDVRVTSAPSRLTKLGSLPEGSLTALAMNTKHGKEYLDKVDALARKYDTDGNGYFSKDEIREFALDLQEAVDQRAFWRRMFRLAVTVGFLILILFTVVFVGAVVGAVSLFKDPNDNPVITPEGLQLVPGTATVVRTRSAELQVVGPTSSLALFDSLAAAEEDGLAANATILCASPVLSDNDGQTLATASASFTAETTLQALLNLSVAELGEVRQLQMALDGVVELFRIASFSAYGWAEGMHHRVLLLHVQDRRDTATVLVSVEQTLLLTGAEIDDIQANHAYMLRPHATDASGRRSLRSAEQILRREWPGRRRLWYTSTSLASVATAALAVAETLAAEAKVEAERAQTALNAAVSELQQISNDLNSVPPQVMDGTDATVAARMRHLVYKMVFAGGAAADRQFQPQQGTSFNATVLFSPAEVKSFEELVAAKLNAALDKTYCKTTGVTNPEADTFASCVGDNASNVAAVVAQKQEELYGLAKYKPDTWVDESTYVAMRFLGDAAHGQVDTDTGTAVQVVRLMVWLSDIQSTACAKLNLNFTFGEDTLIGWEELLADVFTALMAFVQSFVDDTMEQLKLGMEAVLAPIEESVNNLVASAGRRRLEDDEARASSSAAAVEALFLHSLSTTAPSPHAAAAAVAVASRRRHRRQLTEVELVDLLRDVELVTTTTLTFDVDIYSEIDMMPTFTTPPLRSQPIRVSVPVAPPALEVVAEAVFDFQLSGTIYFKGSIGLHFPSNTLNVTVRFKPFATEGQLFYIDSYNFDAGQPTEITEGDLASSFGVELSLSLYGKATGAVAIRSPLGGMDFARRSFVVDAHNVVVAGLVMSSNMFRGSWADPYRQLWSMPALTSTLGHSSASNSSQVTSMTIWNMDMLRKQYGEGRTVADPPGDVSTCTRAPAEFSNASMLGKSQPCVSPEDGTTALCCTSSLDVCVTSDALPHGECRRDASACEGETNCELHFPSIANCTGSGVDSFVYLGAYQPLYYTGDLDAPLRYDPSSGELVPVSKVNLTCPTREAFDPTYYPRNTEPMVDYSVFSLPCFRVA